MTSDGSASFDLIEATIADIHTAIDNEELTFETLTERYLDRIDAYNDELNAIITVNPNAVERARKLDRLWQESGPISPMHGIPVILKDNVNTKDMPTTSGSVLFKETVPPEDAFIARQLRAAGGIILAKANLGEISSGSLSSLGGQTRNPYDRSRDTGGSSSGTGASISTNLGVLGIGTDTGGSVQHPAGFCSLVGLRPTTGLLSRDGIAPISRTQDTAGPMTRTVTDAAVMLDAMVEYDPDDAWTAWPRDHVPESFASCLNRDGLSEARLGVLRQLFGAKSSEGDDPEREAQVVTDVINAAIDDLTAAGADIIELPEIPNLDDKISDASVGDFEFRREFNRYLDQLGSAAPVDSPEEIHESGTVQGTVRFEDRLETDPATLDENLEYLQGLKNKQQLRETLIQTLEDNSLDALVYPMASRIPSLIDEERHYRTASNGKLAAYSGFPVMTVPAGYDAEWGTPVGIQFLAGPFEEACLFEVAYAYEQTSARRVPPENYGAL
jgi:Asp-tRNA(Asn)/Glu-tRNA(Gln) amidotransferase A subunit family amidase